MLTENRVELKAGLPLAIAFAHFQARPPTFIYLGFQNEFNLQQNFPEAQVR